MDEYISKEKTLNKIMSQFPDAHYPSWFASIIKEVPAEDVVSRAELERYRKENRFLHDTVQKNAQQALEVTLQEMNLVRIEAIKEFVERLKQHACFYDLDNYHSFEAIDVDNLDDFVKEMEEKYES